MDRRRFLGVLGSLAVVTPALSWGAAAASLRLGGYQFTQNGQSTSLILDLLGDVRYQVFSLASPPRIVVDLDGVASRMPNANVDLSNTPVSAIRGAPHGNGLRLVLDLRHAIQPQVSLVPGAISGQKRLILELPHTAMAVASAVPTQPAQMTHEGHTSGLRPAVIAIDAGHGGKDPGAVSANDHYEKYVALGVASKLHAMLERNPQFQPTLIRDDDHFVPLPGRVVIAHQRKADMFISIHADAAPSSSAQGASVYVLSEHGATSTMARWVAQSENSADMYATLKDSALYSNDPVLSKVLIDMSMTATIAASLDLGRQMIDDLGQITQIHQRKVDQAGFAVLKSPDIPSILVETGFMSNSDDCARLITESHQQELAESLSSGIAGYFRRFPLAYQRS